MSAISEQDPALPGFAATLLPIMGVVFVAFLVIGIAMPVLPLHVHHGLGMGTFMVGLVAGSQFAASLVSRPWAGNFADSRGAKGGVTVGLLAAAASGLLYLLSLAFGRSPQTSVAVLLLGRGLLGGAESFIITAAVSWGLALADSRSTGKVIAWVGSAMFAAFAIGAPAGAALYAAYGFAAIALATALAPLLTLLLVARLPTVAPVQRARFSFAEVVGAVWVPGLGSALGSVGFGAVMTFAALLFAARGWGNGWLAYTVYAIAFILARVFFSHAGRRGRRRKNRAVLRADRGGRPGADLAGRSSRDWLWRGRPHRVRLLAGLSGLRRRSRPPGAAPEPRPCHGSLHCIPRSGPRARKPCARIGRSRYAGLNVVFLVSAGIVLCARAGRFVADRAPVKSGRMQRQ